MNPLSHNRYTEQINVFNFQYSKTGLISEFYWELSSLEEAMLRSNNSNDYGTRSSP